MSSTEALTSTSDFRLGPGPALPWLALGVVLGLIAGLPEGVQPALWWALSLFVAAGAVALLCWHSLPLAARLALFLAAFAGGAAVPQSSTARPPPISQLVVVDATVERQLFAGFKTGVMVRIDEAHLGDLRRLPRFCKALIPRPPDPRPGDRLRISGHQRSEMWRGRARTVLEATRVELSPREAGPRGFAWAAIDRLDGHHELASALLLGAGRPPERRDFRSAGLLHLLAVSGLHLGLALAGAALLLRFVGAPWWPRQVGLATAALAYLWLTGFGLATQRAAAMCLAYLAAGMLARQAHHLAAPSLAALALIAIDPDHARSPGFQLSLVAVLGILTLGRDLIHLRRRYLPLAPWPLDRPSWRGVLALGRWTGDGLAVGIGASLAVTPVVAWHFGEANPWSPLASLIAGPPLTLVLGAGLPLLLLEGLWPGGPWNGLYVLVDAGLAGLLAVVNWAAATLPGGLVRVAMPSALALLAWPALFLPLRRRSGLLWRGLLLFVLLLLW